MASGGNIILNIVSKFAKGGLTAAVTGFNKLSDVVKKSARTVKSAIGAMAGELGEFGGVLADIARGGIWGGISSGVNLLIDKFRQNAEETIARLKQQAAELAAYVQLRYEMMLASFREKFSFGKTSVSEVVEDQRLVSRKDSEKRSDTAQMKINEITLRALKESSVAQTEEAKKIIQAQRDYEIELIRTKEAMEKQRAIIEDRRLAKTEAEGVMAHAREQLDSAKRNLEGRQRLHEKYGDTESLSNLNKAEALYKEALMNMHNAERARGKAQTELVIALRKRAVIESNNAVALAKAEESVLEARKNEALAVEAAAKEEARAKAKAEAEERRKAVAEKSEQAAQLDGFANRLAATGGVSQNRLTALGLGSGVSPRQSQIAADVKKLVSLMKEEIKATKEISTEVETSATFTE